MATCLGHSKIVEIGNITLIPSSKSEADVYPGDILISLGVSITVGAAVSWKGDQAFPAALVPVDPDHMKIVWPDFGVPLRLNIEWWCTFVEWLAALPEQDVVIHCHGGHGRTGTALAIIMGLSDKVERSHAGEWVQKNYCDHAIESEEQIEYIESILDEKQVGIIPSKQPLTKVGTGKWNGSVYTPHQVMVSKTDTPKEYPEPKPLPDGWPNIYDANPKEIEAGWSHDIDGTEMLKPQYVVEEYYKMPANKIDFAEANTEILSAYYDSLLSAKVIENPANLDTYLPDPFEEMPDEVDGKDLSYGPPIIEEGS